MRDLQRDESFDRAFRVLYPRAVQLARRMVHDTATAEDIAAEALARAFARWNKVRDLPHRDGWVLRVAANLALDAARRQRPRFDPARPLLLEDDAALRLALVDALRALPRRQREVIALRYLAGLSEPDVAAALRLSLGTIKTHANRGVASLRRNLGENFEEETLAG